MADESVEVLVVGAGQAGVAMSEHLSSGGVPHLVLERDRIAERWRTGRWDSLVANGPAWHDRFPGMEFADVDPDAFAAKDQVADYFDAYAEKFAAPIRCGVEVTSVRRNAGRPGFRVETSDGVIEARYVVAATGPFQRPVIPAVVPDDAGPMQIHSSGYRNPEQLPDGAVLVVGAGSSGVQIADELLRSGRRVFLSVGPHDRPPRSYRGRDFCWWLGVLGKWDAETPPPGAEHVTIAVSGADGGHTVDFRDLAARGMTLLGRTLSYGDGTLQLAPDLGVNIAKGDANYLSLLERGRRLRRAQRPRPAGGAGGAPAGAAPGQRQRSRSSSSTSRRPASPRSSGRRASASTTAGCRSTPSTSGAGRSTSAASRPSPASTSSVCRGCRGAGRASSGASGTTPSTWPTRSRSSAATSSTGRARARSPGETRRGRRAPAARRAACPSPGPGSPGSGRRRRPRSARP